MKRDEDVKNWCRQNDIECIEKVGHTLWDPHEIISLNGGSPPVTFAMFNHVVSSIGLPPRPLPDVDMSSVNLVNLEPFPESGLLEQFPSCEDIGVNKRMYIYYYYYFYFRVFSILIHTHEKYDKLSKYKFFIGLKWHVFKYLKIH